MALEKLKVVMEEVTDPAELAQAQAQRERFDRNWIWFKARATEIYERFRGQCVVIAGEQPFAAATAKDAWALAAAAHPNDDGSFALSIPREKVPRSYGNIRRERDGHSVVVRSLRLVHPEQAVRFLKEVINE